MGDFPKIEGPVRVSCPFQWMLRLGDTTSGETDGSWEVTFDILLAVARLCLGDATSGDIDGSWGVTFDMLVVAVTRLCEGSSEKILLVRGLLGLGTSSEVSSRMICLAFSSSFSTVVRCLDISQPFLIPSESIDQWNELPGQGCT